MIAHEIMGSTVRKEKKLINQPTKRVKDEQQTKHGHEKLSTP